MIKEVGALLECRGEAPQLSPRVRLVIQKTDHEQECSLVHSSSLVIPVSSCLPVFVCMSIEMFFLK